MAPSSLATGSATPGCFELQLAHSPFGKPDTLPCSPDNPGPSLPGRILTGLSPPAPGKSPVGCQIEITKPILPITSLAAAHGSGSFSYRSPAVSCPHADTPILLAEPSLEAWGPKGINAMPATTTSVCGPCSRGPMAPAHLAKRIIF